MHKLVILTFRLTKIPNLDVTGDRATDHEVFLDTKLYAVDGRSMSIETLRRHEGVLCSAITTIELTLLIELTYVMGLTPLVAQNSNN